MSKEESSSDKETDSEVPATEQNTAEAGDLQIELETEASGDGEISAPDESVGETPAESEASSESGSEAPTESEISSELEPEPEPEPESEPKQSVPPKPRRSWFSFFNFLLILALAGAAGY